MRIYRLSPPLGLCYIYRTQLAFQMKIITWISFKSGSYSSVPFFLKDCKVAFYLMTVIGFIRRRQWQPTPVLLPGKSHGWRSLVGCHLHRVRHDWSNLAAAAAAIGFIQSYFLLLNIWVVSNIFCINKKASVNTGVIISMFLCYYFHRTLGGKA